jgi:heme a synthase
MDTKLTAVPGADTRNGKMPADNSEPARRNRAVAYWLLAGVVMIILQTLLGGVTRLTGSGLSITKWNPLFGFLPPITETQWTAAFEAYKKIGQFKYVNSYFNLEDFKYIFFWEWLHRVWARLLAVVFTVGFVYFYFRRYFQKSMLVPLLILLMLGGLQGLIGWLMVKTGLNSEDIHVHYVALTVHFVSAMILACYTLWFALKLLIPSGERIAHPKFRNFTAGIILLLFFQLVYGGFMAGLKAAVVAPSWPLINGSFMPETMLTNGIFADANLGALQLNVQFVHRITAYILAAAIIIWFAQLKKFLLGSPYRLLSKSIGITCFVVLLQVILGVVSVLCSVKIVSGKFGIFEIFAELHQLTAMTLLMLMLTNLFLISGKQ